MDIARALGIPRENGGRWFWRLEIFFFFFFGFNFISWEKNTYKNLSAFLWVFLLMYAGKAESETDLK